MLENLPPEIKKSFDDYVNSANKLVPDPQDDKKFYQFIILCHQHNAALESVEIYEILEAKGFDEALQDHLVGLLEGGRELLKEYDRVRK
jgi:hypothetical protein